MMLKGGDAVILRVQRGRRKWTKVGARYGELRIDREMRVEWCYSR